MVLDEVVEVRQKVEVVLQGVLSGSAVLGNLPLEEVVAFHYLCPSEEAAGHLSAYPSEMAEEAYPEEALRALVVAVAFLHASVVHLVGKVVVWFDSVGLVSFVVGLAHLLQQHD